MMERDTRRVAFCGTRGLPANYGGFETAVDEITKRFIAAGYQCDVFCRKSSAGESQATHEGRSLVYVNGSKSRTLDTFVSAIQTGWYLLRNRRRYDHVFWFNNANFPGILLTWFAGIPMSVNTDGLEWRRAKWSWPFKLYYILSSFVISLICRRLISDSYAIQAYYRKHFFAKSTMIPYGAPTVHEVDELQTAAVLERFGLAKERYFLQITRFEPDNLPLKTAKAFAASRLSERGYRMVVIGYKDPTQYATRLKELDGESGVHVLDAIYDPHVLAVLRRNCFCYVHGNSVGGTNPALLEAMAYCPRIMAIDCEFSHEVLGPIGLYFDPKKITPTFHMSVGSPDQRGYLSSRVNQLYQWNAVADAYMQFVEEGKAEYRPVAFESTLVDQRGRD
jgi:glycosyltransferase involved in cell wall biosynthesis